MLIHCYTNKKKRTFCTLYFHITILSQPASQTDEVQIPSPPPHVSLDHLTIPTFLLLRGKKISHAI